MNARVKLFPFVMKTESMGAMDYDENTLKRHVPVGLDIPFLYKINRP